MTYIPINFYNFLQTLFHKKQSSNLKRLKQFFEHETNIEHFLIEANQIIRFFF